MIHVDFTRCDTHNLYGEHLLKDHHHYWFRKPNVGSTFVWDWLLPAKPCFWFALVLQKTRQVYRFGSLQISYSSAYWTHNFNVLIYHTSSPVQRNKTDVMNTTFLKPPPDIAVLGPPPMPPLIYTYNWNRSRKYNCDLYSRSCTTHLYWLHGQMYKCGVALHHTLVT